MEIQVHKRLTLLALLATMLAMQAVPALARKEKADSLVRLMKAESIEQLVMHGQQYRKAISSTFLHNGTYLISDTALWNVDTKIINAVGHVKVIQDETVLTSDKLDYMIDDNLVQFRGTLVQLQNKKKNLLRTRYLDYNTKDSIAIFSHGAAMKDADGQVIESLSGTYNSNTKTFMFESNVNMFSDSMFVKTNLLRYYSDLDKADFPVMIDFWKGGNMLSADNGWYDKGRGTVFFQRNVHALSEEQEAWSDSLFYYRGTGNLLMLGNAQVQDPGREVTAVAERIHYNDTLSQVKLQRNAAVALQTGKDEKRDTIYMGADTLIYRTIRRCDIPEGTVSACESRLADISTDPVAEYRRKAAEAAAAAAAEASKPQGGPGGMRQGKGAVGKPGAEPQGAASEETAAGKEKPVANEEAAPKATGEQERKDSLIAPLNKALAAIDSLVGTAPVADSLAVAPGTQMADAVAGSVPDSTAGPAVPDTNLAAKMQVLATADTVPAAPAPATADTSAAVPASDTTKAPLDSAALAAAADTVKLDTTKIGFVYGVRNVRIFRDDIQMRCDSMCYCDLDSIARFYRDPVVWNDGNRQYTADSLFILIGGGGPRKASLQSNAFVIIQEDPVSFDQIKGAEVLAYFDSLDSSLKRFDALGGSSAIFYLRENEAFATVNKVESKMLSGWLVDGDIDHVYYFEQPKNNAYPVVQMPEAERKMKGFNWRPDERPASPEDITTLKIRASAREYYESKPRPEFRETDLYFPGYMPRILKEIAVRDSLAKIPKPKRDTAVFHKPHLADSLQIETLSADSLAVADSLAAVSDSLAADGLARADSLAVATVDSLAVKAPADSLAVKEEIDPLSVPTVDPKQKRKEDRELRRKLRIAARDARIAAREARWAELDRQDSLKLAAKKQKELEKQRAKTLKLLLAIQKQDAKDEAKLQKYIAKYQKQYEREQKRKAARERSQATGSGGEVPTPPGSGEEAPRGDAVLGDDGSPDDDPVLSGGGVPGT